MLRKVWTGARGGWKGLVWLRGLSVNSPHTHSRSKPLLTPPPPTPHPSQYSQSSAVLSYICHSRPSRGGAGWRQCGVWRRVPQLTQAQRKPAPSPDPAFSPRHPPSNLQLPLHSSSSTTPLAAWRCVSLRCHLNKRMASWGRQSCDCGLPVTLAATLVAACCVSDLDLSCMSV